MQTIDYYTILGVSRDASGEELRKAFRGRAREFHPDINKDEEAEARFKELNEAYEVLRDPDKRKRYDLYGENWQHEEPGSSGDRHRQYGEKDRSYHFTSQHNVDPADLDEILQQLFGKAGTSSNLNRDHGPFMSSVKKKVELELVISLKELFCGATKHLAIETVALDGDGTFRPVTRELKVTIPQGVTDGSVIRLGRDNGAESMEDLYIRLKVIADQRFTVDGFDLRTEVAVTPWEAALGGKVEVDTVDGQVTLSLPKGSQNSTVLRIKGKGLKKKDGQHGDIFVSLQILLPERYGPTEEKLLREIAKESSFNPRKLRGQRAVEKV